MILSNEPGYYKPGTYGIRIENLVAVKTVGTPDGGERELLGFENLTRVPLDRHLILTSMLTAEELAWVNDYHALVRTDLESLLEGHAKAWLIDATAVLSA
jgi:Xaa-Pro aminopeptidase